MISPNHIINSQHGQQYTETPTGRYVFENERQTFKTKKNKDLELTTANHSYEHNGTKIIAIKVIDIFGNDNMTTIQIKL